MTEPTITVQTADRGPVTVPLTSDVLRLLDKAVPGPNGCLLWSAYVHPHGYGLIRMNGKYTTAHRAAYALLVQRLVKGMQIDHACHNVDTTCQGGVSCLHRRCINPLHLESVTAFENAKRSPHTVVGRNLLKTHCDHGHPFDEANTYVRPDNGARVCRRCRADRMKGYLVEAQASRPTDLPICGHVSRDAKTCTRSPGHAGKHHAQYEVAR